MDTLEQITVQDVVQIVRRWPEGQRRALLHALVDLAAAPTAAIAPPSPRLSAWNDLRGIIASDRPLPTDEQIAQWLDERRMEHSHQ